VDPTTAVGAIRLATTASAKPRATTAPAATTSASKSALKPASKSATKPATIFSKLANHHV
jgi:hypothetical protein